MYADDTALFPSDEEDYRKMREKIKVYETASNSRVNWEKSVGFGFGALRHAPPEGWLGDWLGPDQVTRYLGIYITPNLNLDLIFG